MYKESYIKTYNYSNLTLLDAIKVLHQELTSKYDSTLDKDSTEKIINLFI